MSWRPEQILLTLTIGALLAACTAGALAEQEAPASKLHVCADPDVLPYSHRDGSGVHNRIAALLAQQLGAELVMHWVPQPRGFASRVLMRQRCELVLGVPEAGTRLRTTRPLTIAQSVRATARPSVTMAGQWPDARELTSRRAAMQPLARGVHEPSSVGMAIGVARGARNLLPRLERALDARRADVDAILASPPPRAAPSP
jgi:hypothetical protein